MTAAIPNTPRWLRAHEAEVESIRASLTALCERLDFSPAESFALAAFGLTVLSPRHIGRPGLLALCEYRVCNALDGEIAPRLIMEHGAEAKSLAWLKMEGYHAEYLSEQPAIAA